MVLVVHGFDADESNTITMKVIKSLHDKGAKEFVERKLVELIRKKAEQGKKCLLLDVEGLSQFNFDTIKDILKIKKYTIESIMTSRELLSNPPQRVIDYYCCRVDYQMILKFYENVYFENKYFKLK
jgi:hypothetical protein